MQIKLNQTHNNLSFAKKSKGIDTLLGENILWSYQSPRKPQMLIEVIE